MEISDSEDSVDEFGKANHNFVTKLVENGTNKSNEETYRVSFTSKAEAEKWLNLYQKKTRTHWIVDKTFPDPER